MLLLKSGYHEALDEYQSLLDQLDEEAQGIKEIDEKHKTRMDEIKKQVGGILDNLAGVKSGESKERTVVEVRSGRTWDRHISYRGAGLDLGLLEEALGTIAYRRLCTTRQVTYSFDALKLQNARERSKVTEKQISGATLKGTAAFSYYRTSLEKIKDES